MGMYVRILDLFFAPRCCQCGVEGSWFCETCLLKIPQQSIQAYRDGLYFYGYLQDPLIQKLIHLLKYAGITEPVRRYLSVCNSSPEWKSACFIPVPVSTKRRKERGYNQAEIIADELAKKCLGIVVVNLIGKYERVSLVGKSREERISQAAHQFYWMNNEIPPASSYIVVDDVITTGSTLLACLQILRDNGVSAIGVSLAHER